MAHSGRRLIAGMDIERHAAGGNRLCQSRCIALALAQGQECKAEVVLGRGPLGRHREAGLNLERRAESGHSLCQARLAAFALAQGLQRIAETRSE